MLDYLCMYVHVHVCIGREIMWPVSYDVYRLDEVDDTEDQECKAAA